MSILGLQNQNNGIVPLNIYDELQKSNELFDKIKRVQNTILGIAVLRNHLIKKDRSEMLDEYKFQIIKEEFLDFTPTPKDRKLEEKLRLSFGKQLDYSSDEESQELSKGS